MKIEAFELRRVAMPLVAPFETSFGVQQHRDILLVRALTDGPDGWGECVAMGAPLYSSEYTDGAEHVLREHLLPALLRAGDVPAASVGHVLRPFHGHRMAKAAVETAVLDAELRASGTSLAAYLGAVRDRVDSGVSVGIAPSIPALLDEVGRYLDQGYLRIKLKVKPGWDVEPVAAVRGRFGDDILLQVDANAAYTLADARQLAMLDAFDLILVEQPLPEEDIRGHARLATVLRTPICLDESITSAAAAADAIAIGACSVVNIKAGRVGGYLEARRVADVCAANGVPVWCGGMLETGVGRAANVALAALPQFVLPGDTSASNRYWAEDLTEPFELVGGQVAVPQGPGLGVTPLADVLTKITVSVERVDP